MNIVIISGSPRKNSNTLRVANAIAKSKELQQHNTSIIDFHLSDIPFANHGEINTENLTPFQEKLLTDWKNSKLVIILSPEYNWFPSAEIINMIHRFGEPRFKYLFDEKIFALGAVSSGRGGRIPAIQLSYVISKLVNYMDCVSIVSSKILETQFATQVLDDKGNSLGNSMYDKGMEKFITYNIKLAEMLP
jgi:chromate reductase